MHRSIPVLALLVLALAGAAQAANVRLSTGTSTGNFFGNSIGLDFRDGRLVAAWADNSLAGNPDPPALDIAFTALGGANVNVTGLPLSQAGPSLAIDPTDPNRIVLAALDAAEGSNVSALRAFSRDGGATWTIVRGLPGNFGSFSPDVAFDAFGNCWLTLINDPTFGDPRVELFRSTDGGVTFTAVPLPNVAGLETVVSVAAGFGAVWLAYDGHDGARVRIGTLAAPVSPSGELGAFVEQSLGEGDTPDLALGPGGRVLIAFGRNQFATNPSVAARVDADGLGPAGFGPAVTVANVRGYPHSPTPRVAFDTASGRGYVVFREEQEPADEHVYLAFDDGSGWSPAIRLSDTATAQDRILPRVAVDPASGEVGAAWLDLRFGGADAIGEKRSAPATPAEPRQPLDLFATAVSRTQIDLRWTDTSNNETAFQVQRGIGNFNVPPEIIATLPAGTTSFSDTGLPEDSGFGYRVRAINGAGVSLWSNGAFAITLDTPPTAPSNLVAVGVSFQRIDLTWSPSDDADGYEIQQSTDAVTWTSLGRGNTGTSAMLFGLQPDTTYFFRVRGFNSGGDSPFSNVASARTVATPPLFPSALTATVISRSRIDLAWTDNSTSEDRFDIERSTDGRAFRLVASVGPNVTRYSDTERIRPSTTYTYRVRACAAAGCSLPSNAATATTPGR
jgi:hypothetical protein